MHPPILELLAAEWQLEDVLPDDRETQHALDAFEDRFSRKLPSDMRAFYERFNGLLEMDSGLNRFWPLDELDTVPAVFDPRTGSPHFSGIAERLPHANEYFAFADHSIWVCVYAIQLAATVSESGTVVWIGGGNKFDIIADTFTEFWELYLATPGRALLP